jgi:CRP-like cAMP-binding protein
MAQQANSPNHFLSTLPNGDFDLLRPHLHPLEMIQEDILFQTGDIIERVYFPHTGIISLVIELSGGDRIEAAMIGPDSVVGGSSVLNGKIALNTAIVQATGRASVINADRFKDAVNASAGLRSALTRHDQLILVQAQQSVACNISHTLEARLARWLLRSRDLLDSNTLPLTQEFLAQMLGVRRTSVSLVAGTLQTAGFIRYRRGHVAIVDAEGLQSAACECYETVKAQAERLLKGQSGP